MAARYSHSRLEKYFNCPLSYKFRYVDKIKSDVKGIEAFMGSMVHEVLEKIYKDKTMGKENTLEKLLAYYDEVWDKNYDDKIQIVKKEYTADDYRAVGRQALVDYFNRYHPFNDGKTLGLEKMISIDLKGDNRYRLVGYVDRITIKDDGRYEIHDYKTSNSMPTQDKIDNDSQLALYQLAIEQMWPDAKEIDLIWHYLRFDKELVSKRNREDIEKLKTTLIKKIDEVEKSVEEKKFEPIESALCNWCDYQALCPKRKHLVKVEGLPVNELLKEDGVTLVNKYAKAKNELKAYKEEKEAEVAKLEEAIVALAKREGFDVIIGSDHQVKVNFTQKEGWPTKTKDPQQRKALEDLIQKLELFDKVAELSTTKLSLLLEDGILGEKQKAQLMKFSIVEEKPRISLSKLKKE